MATTHPQPARPASAPGVAVDAIQAVLAVLAGYPRPQGATLAQILTDMDVFHPHLGRDTVELALQVLVGTEVIHPVRGHVLTYRWGAEHRPRPVRTKRRHGHRDLGLVTRPRPRRNHHRHIPRDWQEDLDND